MTFPNLKESFNFQFIAKPAINPPLQASPAPVGSITFFTLLALDLSYWPMDYDYDFKSLADICHRSLIKEDMKMIKIWRNISRIGTLKVVMDHIEKQNNTFKKDYLEY